MTAIKNSLSIPCSPFVKQSMINKSVMQYAQERKALALRLQAKRLPKVQEERKALSQSLASISSNPELLYRVAVLIAKSAFKSRASFGGGADTGELLKRICQAQGLLRSGKDLLTACKTIESYPMGYMASEAIDESVCALWALAKAYSSISLNDEPTDKTALGLLLAKSGRRLNTKKPDILYSAVCKMVRHVMPDAKDGAYSVRCVSFEQAIEQGKQRELEKQVRQSRRLHECFTLSGSLDSSLFDCVTRFDQSQAQALKRFLLAPEKFRSPQLRKAACLLLDGWSYELTAQRTGYPESTLRSLKRRIASQALAYMQEHKIFAHMVKSK